VTAKGYKQQKLKKIWHTHTRPFTCAGKAREQVQQRGAKKTSPTKNPIKAYHLSLLSLLLYGKELFLHAGAEVLGVYGPCLN
jgi:hypothetical protein